MSEGTQRSLRTTTTADVACPDIDNSGVLRITPHNSGGETETKTAGSELKHAESHTFQSAFTSRTNTQKVSRPSFAQQENERRHEVQSLLAKNLNNYQH